MVWGLALPSSYNAFFPGGDYVGWREGLLAYFQNEMPAEQKDLFYNALSYPSYVSNKFSAEPDKEGSSERPPFSPAEPHEAPMRFTLRKKYSKLGSLIETQDQILSVDEPLKDIIERFEPEMHRFFPIEIIMPGNEDYPRRFFIMAIGQYLDSFSTEHSEPNLWRDSEFGTLIIYRKDKESMSGLALSKRIFGKAHLWRERRMSPNLVCFSDSLMREINDAGLRLPPHYRLKEF
jgi:hypothetical protein